MNTPASRGHGETEHHETLLPLIRRPSPQQNSPTKRLTRPKQSLLPSPSNTAPDSSTGTTDEVVSDTPDEGTTAKPTAQVNLHVTRWMRIGLTGGYRFVRGPSLGEISDGDLEGVTAGGHIQFGWF